MLETRFGIGRVMLTPSCTAALEMAALLLGLGPGDEVIMPSFTFVSTANAFVRAGARPVFVDVRPDTLNLDDALVEAAITPRTKAIVAVHYAGVACEMERLDAIASQHGVALIEDAAQGVNAFYQGRALGSLAPLAAYSFHETKNYVCGEGGALCINAPEWIERAEIIQEKGTNRSQFLRGQVDKYTWVDVGGSFVPSELAAAFLLAQLEHLAPLTERRREIYETYVRLLAPLEKQGLLRLPVVPDDCQSNYHMFYVLLPNGATRDALLRHLKGRGISATFHYVPLHTSPKGLELGCPAGSLPQTEDLSARLLRLPFYHELTADEQQYVAAEIEAFLRARLPVESVAVERRG